MYKARGVQNGARDGPSFEISGRSLGMKASVVGDMENWQKKSRRGPRSRSSQYRGVTFYRRTGRWESHIWLAINM